MTGPPPTVTDTAAWPPNTFPPLPLSIPGTEGTTTNGTAPPPVTQGCQPNAKTGACGPGVCAACCSAYIPNGPSCESCVANKCPAPPSTAGVVVDDNLGASGYPIMYLLLCVKT